MTSHTQDPSLALIETRSLIKRAKSVVPRVRERAVEALIEHAMVAASENDPECLKIYQEALKEVTRDQTPQ